MKTNYPKCMEDTPSECRFVEGTRNATSMHSPIVRSRTGEPVAGGSNQINCTLSCVTCGRSWSASMTELDVARGILPQWKLNR